MVPNASVVSFTLLVTVLDLGDLERDLKSIGSEEPGVSPRFPGNCIYGVLAVCRAVCVWHAVLTSDEFLEAQGGGLPVGMLRKLSHLRVVGNERDNWGPSSGLGDPETCLTRNTLLVSPVSLGKIFWAIFWLKPKLPE